MNINQILNFLKATFSAWVEDHASSMGAAIAYYTIFSIAPILLIILSVVGLIFDIEVVRIEIYSRLQDLMGENGALVVQDLLENSQAFRKHNCCNYRYGFCSDWCDVGTCRVAG